MSFRLPQNLNSGLKFETGASILDAEIASEKAAALGRLGRKVVEALARLEEARSASLNDLDPLLKAAAEATWMFFVQRESIGLRDQRQVIRDLNIPRAVIARIGAR